VQKLSAHTTCLTFPSKRRAAPPTSARRLPQTPTSRWQLRNDGGDEVDGMGNARGELDVVAEEMGLRVLQGNNVLVQVDEVSDQAVPSAHDVRMENVMQEQSVGDR